MRIIQQLAHAAFLGACTGATVVDNDTDTEPTEEVVGDDSDAPGEPESDDSVDPADDGEDDPADDTDEPDDDESEQADTDGDGVLDWLDCEPDDPAINQAAVDDECDGIDQDCDGEDGSDIPTAIGGSVCSGVDEDGDGYMTVNSDGDVVDCDDNDDSVHPDAAEIPDNGIDDDCKGGDEVTEPAADVPDDLGEELSWLRVDGASVGMILSTDIFPENVSGDEVCVTGFGLNSSWECDGDNMVTYDGSTGFMWFTFSEGEQYRVTWYSESEGEWAQYSDECADSSTDSALCYSNSDAQGNGNGTDGDDGYSLCLEVVGGFVYELDDSTCATM